MVASGMSVRQAAEKLGVSASTVSRYARDEAFVSPEGGTN